MKRALIALAALFSLTIAAHAQNNWPTPGGADANGAVMMCLNAAGNAVPVSSGQCGGSAQVQPLFGRTKLITATFTPGTSYAAGNSFGGKLTFATGVISGQVQIRRVMVAGSAATLTASANLDFFGFNANPATTFTDGSSPTWSSTDNGNFDTAISLSNATAANGQISNAYLTASSTFPIMPQTINTDGSGNIYGALISGGTWTMTTPAQFTVTVEIGY